MNDGIYQSHITSMGVLLFVLSLQLSQVKKRFYLSAPPMTEFMIELLQSKKLITNLLQHMGSFPDHTPFSRQERLLLPVRMYPSLHL